MANVNCYGSLVGANGATIPFFNNATTEGTSDEVKSDSNYVGSAVSVGTYGAQLPGGFVLSQGGVVCENDMAFCFIRSAGDIKACVSMGSGVAGGSQGLPASLPYPKRLDSGDQLMVMTQTVADRGASVMIACSNGQYHAFTVTPAGSGEHEFVSVLTGQSVGQTLQGRTATHWMATSGNNDAELTSPPFMLNGSGVPVGSVSFTSSGGAAAATWQGCRVPISLNSRLVFRTDA